MRNINYDPDEQCTKAVIFTRVSTEDQFKTNDSISAQKDKLEEYCKNKNLKVLKIYEVPESSTTGKRKLFYEMLDFVRAQKHKTAIVSHCIDRLQRTYKEYNELDTLRTEGRIELHFYKENLIIHKDSPSSDIFRWDFGILGAKMYVGALRDNVKRSQLYKWQQGQWQSFAPIGYLNTENENGKADIIVDPVRAPMVQKLFQEYATGQHSLASLEGIAHQMGLKSARKNCTHTLSRVQIHEMLTNPFYIGTMVLMRKNRKQNRNRKPIYYPHRYPHLVSKELFNQVQCILKEKDKNNTGITSKAWYGEKDFVLRGLIRCSHCGGLMCSERHKKKSGNIYTYLRCNHLDKNCPQKPIPEDEVLRQIEEKVFQPIRLTPTLIKNIQKAVKEGFKEDAKLNATNKKNITLRIQELEDKKKKLVHAWLDGKINDIIYNEMVTELNQNIEEAKELADKYDNYDNELDEKLEKISDIALNAKEIFKSSINEEKHKILKLILSNSQVNGKNLYFSINKPFDKLLFSKGCKTWYQVLRDYRINYPEELLKWKYKIEHILDDDFYNLAYK